jgi:3-deoxy-D-manno-octulosonic-acid transferase
MMFTYNLISLLLLPLYFFILGLRLYSKKELLGRLRERFGYSTLPRPRGDLIWLHAASVGESVATLNLIENINAIYPKMHFLVTSGTVSSANILQAKLPQNARHQFLPIDNLMFIRRFLKHWRPSLGIFIESELWPCIISEGAKFCKLLLFNAHISAQSYKYWSKFRMFFQSILDNFSEIIAQSSTDYDRFIALGVKQVQNLGNIKFANKKLEVDAIELSILQKILVKKQVIVLASTHLEDENVCLEIIKPMRRKNPDCYFILVLRHPQRKMEVSKTCQSLNLNFSIRSQTKLPNLNDDLYIVDTFGELGLFYSLANISFIGGSFKQGGHNLLEPAFFSNLIFFGPDMSNYYAIAEEMVKNKAAVQIHNSDELRERLQYFSNPANVTDTTIYKKNCIEFLNQNQQILHNYLNILGKYIKND